MGNAVANVKTLPVAPAPMEFSAPASQGRYLAFDQPHYLPPVSTSGFELVLRIMSGSEVPFAGPPAAF